jgi:hypothetical protein
MTKVLLGVAVTTLILGFVLNAGWVGSLPWDALYAILPLGAVFFGLFLIAKMLEKETQAYDLEHKHCAGATPGATDPESQVNASSFSTRSHRAASFVEKP